MNINNFVLNVLQSLGVKNIFTVPAGLIDPFLLTFTQQPDIKAIVACQEGGAAYMADGYSRASNKLGVYICIGGPGITNSVTPLATALTDHSSVLSISGQVPIDLQGLGGFQDSSAAGLNEYEVLSSVTLAQYIVNDARLISHHLYESLLKALSPPFGPVYLALPKNIQTAELTESHSPFNPPNFSFHEVNEEALQTFWQMLQQTGKIAILAGAGVEKSEASAELIKFAERFKIPVATTLRAKGVISEKHPLALGVFGYSGSRHAIEMLLSDEVETLIVLGSHLNQRDTMYWDKQLQSRRFLIHVDLDPSAIGSVYHTHLPIISDCYAFLKKLNQMAEANDKELLKTTSIREQWLQKIRALGSRFYDEENYYSDKIPIHPARVINELQKVMPDNTVICVDSGAHRAFTGHYWIATQPRHY
jgi:acetolactate synthase-1/2/3 large subunit